jgi:hypothetical protein
VNVLHAPRNVGSQASGLAQGENAARRLYGIPGRSWSVNFSPSPAVAPADEDYPLRARAEDGLLGKLSYATSPLLYGLRRIRQFDLLHLYFGESLFSFSRSFPRLEMLDLPLWRAAGKRIFMTFQGCDVRLKTIRAHAPVSACRAGFCEYAACDARLDERRMGMVQRARPFLAKAFCLNPDLLPFVPESEFLPYASVDPALFAAGREDDAGPPAGRLPVVAHAPSDRSIKGTSWLEKASAELQEDVPHDLALIEGVPHGEVAGRYRRADLVVDQLLVGWYGGVAVEAMALGRPVVAYLAPDCLEAIPRAMRQELPIVSATPDTVGRVLAELIGSPGRRRMLGARGREFVRRWHDPLKIARAMLRLYEDPSLSFWALYDPSDPRPATREARP